MTYREFTEVCAEKCTGVIQMAAKACFLEPIEIDDKCQLFVEHMLEQDSDDGSRSGTRRTLGDFLYMQLQLFKPESDLIVSLMPYSAEMLNTIIETQKLLQLRQYKKAKNELSVIFYKLLKK